MLISMTKRKIMLEVLRVELVHNRAIKLIGHDGMEEYIATRAIRGIPDLADGDVFGLFERITKLAVESNGGAIRIDV